MRRGVYVPGVAAVAVLAVALTGCTGSDGEDLGLDAKTSGASSSSTVPSGKYRSLPEPCVAVERNRLLSLLPKPAADDGSDTKNSASSKAREEALLGGEPALTFDTDRRVGCTWQRASVDGSRRLRIDFERVVSYDPEVSDDVRATQVFQRKAQEHGVLARDLPDEGGTSPQTEESSPAATPPGGGTGSPAADAELLAPRVLEEPGDEAFLDERVGSADAGVRRDVTVIFRTANVVVTVEYGQSTNDPTLLPDAAELQGKAQELARSLAGRFSG
ncbi:hypothetical protein SRB5_58840 [Streptomyces sp. RB5]|uniref:DUF3558 domain-containing protein n=1 Tax=Streptomyces smaragdinus TaxID=2585196 RepID=A0A7K0CQE1_9ACTN|nr:DUF3558 domain-containing protein [Streptomyces smaragdinus]MQY15696.1 hypothetical protein [Streptomyces smaragdinus]